MSPDGKFYTSSGNGSILRIDVEKKQYYHEVFTGGRPLGLAFATDGRLLVADAVFGLLAVDLKTKSIEAICNFVAGRPVRFANAVVVAKDGTIYFTDSTDIAPVQETTGLYNTHHSAVMQILVANPTGRVIRVDPKLRQATVLDNSLSFANGISLSKKEDFLIVCDLGRNAIRRIWLSGPKEGKKEYVLENLPGFPDNIHPSADGGWWIALASQRSALIDAIHPYPLVKSALLKIPLSWTPRPPPLAQILKISPDLKIQYRLFDESGHIPVVTDALEHKGKLYLAAVNAHYWAVFDLKNVEKM